MSSISMFSPEFYLTDVGVSKDQLIAEMLWLQFKGIDVTSIAGAEEYKRISRRGLPFSMNRKQRIAVIEFVTRAQKNIVTNQEIALFEQE